MVRYGGLLLNKKRYATANIEKVYQVSATVYSHAFRITQPKPRCAGTVLFVLLETGQLSRYSNKATAWTKEEFESDS